jgi:hypothetical protein
MKDVDARNKPWDKPAHYGDPNERITSRPGPR